MTTAKQKSYEIEVTPNDFVANPMYKEASIAPVKREWKDLSPDEKKEEDERRFVLETLEPNDEKRNMLLTSLKLFLQQKGITFIEYSQENQAAIMSAVLRIGIPVSESTIYPRSHYVNGKQILIIQDNYLFLIGQLKRQLGAEAVIVDVIYNSEEEYLKKNNITKFTTKDEVMPLWELDKKCDFEDIAYIRIALSFKNRGCQYVKTYTKDKLMKRVGKSISTGRIWKGADMVLHPEERKKAEEKIGKKIEQKKAEDNLVEQEKAEKEAEQLAIDIGFKDHSITEMLKKTAIRAYAKENFGDALDIIRVIDIEQFKFLNDVQS